MMATNEEVLSVLRQLIAVCEAARREYRLAAGIVGDNNLKQLFAGHARRCAQFATALRAEMRLRGSYHRHMLRPTPDGRAGADTTASAPAPRDDAAIIAHCARHITTALQAYTRAHRMRIPADVMMLINRQCTEIQRLHTHIHAVQQGGAPEDSPQSDSSRSH